MSATTPESILNEQLATCLLAINDCLNHSREAHDGDPQGHRRRNDLAYVAKLMKASARITMALARLKGETQHAILVTHRMADKGGRR